MAQQKPNADLRFGASLVQERRRSRIDPMAESVLNIAALQRPLIERKDRAPQIPSNGAQDLKSAIHRELINKLNATTTQAGTDRPRGNPCTARTTASTTAAASNTIDTTAANRRFNTTRDPSQTASRQGAHHPQAREGDPNRHQHSAARSARRQRGCHKPQAPSANGSAPTKCRDAELGADGTERSIRGEERPQASLGRRQGNRRRGLFRAVGVRLAGDGALTVRRGPSVRHRRNLNLNG